MIELVAAVALRRLLAQGTIEALSPLTQAGILGSLLALFGLVIRALFVKMIASKDAEIASAHKAREAAEASRDRFEQKLDAQQQTIQERIIVTLMESSTTTRKALEIFQRERP